MALKAAFLSPVLPKANLSYPEPDTLVPSDGSDGSDGLTVLTIHKRNVGLVRFTLGGGGARWLELLASRVRFFTD